MAELLCLCENLRSRRNESGLDPLTRPATAGENAVARHPLPQGGEGWVFIQTLQALKPRCFGGPPGGMKIAHKVTPAKAGVHVA